MIKHIETPFLHLEIKDGNCEVTGTGNTWQYLLLFAYIVKAAKEGRFTNGFDDKGEEKEFIRILNKVYECPIEVHHYMDDSTRVRIIYIDNTPRRVTRIIDVTGMTVKDAYEYVVHSISYSDVKKISKEEVDAIDAIEGKVMRRYLYAYVHSPECFECTKVRLGID